MDIRITPGRLFGTVTPPASKSMAHRLLIAAALSQGTSRVQGVTLCRDVEATLRCMSALGVRWQMTAEGTVTVYGVGNKALHTSELPTFDCGESGSTLRFFIPIALALTHGGRFLGQGRLMERPQSPYFDIFDRKGISYTLQDGGLTVRGQLTPGTYELPGDVSSQFFSGLMFALPGLGEDSVIESATPLQSRGYITMTAQVLGMAGIDVTARSNGRDFCVGHGTYRALDCRVEPDWSQAGFFHAANCLGCSIDVSGMDPRSAQGDRAVISLAEELMREGDSEIDISECPDLLPPLAVLAMCRKKTTRFKNAARLRLKESDRLHTVCRLITSLGGEAEEGSDFLEVRGTEHPAGGVAEGAGDHRIVMAAAIAAVACTSPVTILGAEAVCKSYPGFFDDYSRLGGIADVL